MSRYIGKRVSYPCGGCGKQFTMNKKSVDDSINSGQVFCSEDCKEQFYLSIEYLYKKNIMSKDIREMIDKVKNFKQFLNEQTNEPKFAYHVTRRKNLASIKEKGLEPRIPKDYGTTNGDVKGVYLFKTIEDTQNALYNWLGERIEEWEEENDKEYDEVVLKINISGLEEHLIDSVEYEWTCLVNIEPSRIVDVIEM